MTGRTAPSVVYRQFVTTIAAIARSLPTPAATHTTWPLMRPGRNAATHAPQHAHASII
jgi:hypothetical protein